MDRPQDHPAATPALAQAGPGGADQRIDDLGQIILAYNQVTENLQRSHDALRQEVLRLQEELASTDAQLQRSRRLAALGEMAAGIAHEIRNPLNAIGLYAGFLVEDLETLAQGGPAEDAAGTLQRGAETAQKIASAVHGLEAIVCDVLSFAREVRPRLAGVPVARLLRRALEAQQPDLDAAGVRVAALPNPAADLWVRADADLIHQALLNLIRNAVEAMQGPCRELHLGARREGSRVVVSVRDTGPGIPEEAIDRIFNPFFTTRNTGTGLGLAIVHRIVDAHAGAMAVRNEALPPGGALFELNLPAAEPAAGGAAADHAVGPAVKQALSL